jgi:hypothetical protein
MTQVFFVPQDRMAAKTAHIPHLANFCLTQLLWVVPGYDFTYSGAYLCCVPSLTGRLPKCQLKLGDNCFLNSHNYIFKSHYHNLLPIGGARVRNRFWSKWHTRTWGELKVLD